MGQRSFMTNKRNPKTRRTRIWYFVQVCLVNLLLCLVQNRNAGPQGQVRVQLALPSEQFICYNHNLSCTQQLKLRGNKCVYFANYHKRYGTANNIFYGHCNIGTGFYQTSLAKMSTTVYEPFQSDQVVKLLGSMFR